LDFRASSGILCLVSGVEAAARKLETLRGGTGSEIRSAIIDILDATGHGDGACVFHYGLANGHATVDLGAAVSDERLLDSLRVQGAYYEEYARPCSTVLDYARQRPEERERFVEYAAISPQFWSSAVYRDAYRPFGLADGQRLLVYDGPELTGWAGFIRASRGRFTRADRQRVAALAGPVRAAMLVAHRLRSETSPVEAAELVLSPDGEPLHASKNGRWWLGDTQRAAALRREVQRLDRGSSPDDLRRRLVIHGWAANLVRMDGAGGATYLALLEPAPPVRLSPLEMLPPSLRRVGHGLAEGWSDKEIADRLSMPLTTVRTYVRRILSRVGAENRAHFAAQARTVSASGPAATITRE
jgi:hypothetical protein